MNLVWRDPELQPLINDAKKLIHSVFKQNIEVEIYVCTLDELQEAIISELITKKVMSADLNLIKPRLKRLDGRYFKNTNQVWLVQDQGTNLDTIIHELLYSIQNCHEHREGIVYYITYKLTNNKQHINLYRLKDWQEIERQEKFDSIKKRFLQKGDCEEFES